MSEPRRGLWIVFEGGDSVGKTTQVELLTKRLIDAGHDVRSTREPGGTPLGLVLRKVVLHGEYVDPRAEALMYAADRAQHIATLVNPALGQGAVVIQDRYIGSSIVYQGKARGMGADIIRNLSLWAAVDARPDITIVLNREPIPFERDMDRLERDMAEQADEIRAAFAELANTEPNHRLVAADGDIADVASRVWAEIAPLIAARRELISA